MSPQSRQPRSFGVVGGMGPASTVRFLDLVISKYRVGQSATLNSDFPQITMYSIPDSDHVSGSPNRPIVRSLKRAFEVFKSAEVTFAVMPCNTVHQFIPIFGEDSEVQVLSIPSAVSNSLKELSAEKTLFLATRQTQQSGIYDWVFSRNQCEPVSLEDPDQDALDDIIRLANPGGAVDSLCDRLLAIIKRYPSSKTVLFACTELSLLLPLMKNVTVVDSLESLADATYLVSSGQRELTSYTQRP